MTARLALLLIMFVCANVAGAQSPSPLSIKLVPPDAATLAFRGPRWEIHLDGEIDKGAADRLSGLVESKQIRYATIYLNSPGGDLLAGIRLGRLIRKHAFSTRIAGEGLLDPGSRTPDQCLSACVFAFVGGHFRYQHKGAVIGVHRFSRAKPDSADLDLAQVISAAITSHLIEMGVDVSLFELMSRVRKDDIYLLTPAEATQLRVANVSSPVS